MELDWTAAESADYHEHTAGARRDDRRRISDPRGGGDPRVPLGVGRRRRGL